MVDLTYPRAVALAVVVLVAGCGNSGANRAATSTAPGRARPCKLNAAQRRAVSKALADIRRLRRIQAPMQHFSMHGARGQNQLTGQFEIDLGSAHLPLKVYARLVHLAKTAVSLCGDCSNGLEAIEPVLGNRTDSAQLPYAPCTRD